MLGTAVLGDIFSSPKLYFLCVTDTFLRLKVLFASDLVFTRPNLAGPRAAGLQQDL